MAANTSADLLWMLTRSNSSFLVKRESGRIQLSKDPFNLMNKNSFKYSGLANGKSADIRQYENKGIVLTTKLTKAATSPAKSVRKVVCSRDFERNFKKVANCVSKTVGGYYRPDLEKSALARWTKYHRALKKTKAMKAGKK
ncbi:large subunit ribosomal protein L28e, cytoplasmic [Guillardia theta CCMP2712]|uniref:Large subunit ribosomal protein L28e, cytoplasmic n=1 Tax=Guillardia theta (strain CCMP2712) TaxID=905079 RepID=L1JIS0_GUITC|nr:large subunit ribosomal protein L28e, cytoplasmic [Guillardia theta CCMP2712]EKX47990.1 large subunit ribosomal protein L28e, cytoplasmic [Guillardia theta CCMP2712]|eukprot:XP_005834970.1 large subunit ribosomal protein L28e, cytoplasmic [Guillardia theta CCMP2712]